MSKRQKRRFSFAMMLLCLAALFNNSLFDDLFVLITDNDETSTRRSLQFGDDSELLGVQFAIYHIPVPNTKYNLEKFSPAEYSAGLDKTCSTLSSLGHTTNVNALGDQEYITSMPSCTHLATPNVGITSSTNFDNLHYQELSALSEKHMCRRKFGTDKHDHRRITREISLVYLNRFEALCDLAETQPDHLTVLLDTDFDDTKWGDVQKTVSKRMDDPTDHSITTSKYPKIVYRNWYGREPCQDWSGFPSAKSDFLAIRGKDCPVHRKLYKDWLDEHLEYGKTLMHGVAKGCPCYDDEKVFHYMGVDNPGIITFVAEHLEGEKGEELIKIFIDNHYVDNSDSSNQLEENEEEEEEEEVVEEGGEVQEEEVMIDPEADSMEQENNNEEEVNLAEEEVNGLDPDVIEQEEEVIIDPDVVEGYEYEDQVVNADNPDDASDMEYDENEQT